MNAAQPLPLALVSVRSVNAARMAAWELDALLDLLLCEVGPDMCKDTPAATDDALRTRGVAMRMRALTSVLMSVVTGDADEADEADEIEEKLYGRKLATGDGDD